MHTGHQGETKCLFLARQSVFWPGISNDVRQMVKDCALCNRHQRAQPKLPAMQPDLPTRPWEKLGSDIFQFNGANYLINVDYYSRFPVIRPLCDISASTVSSHFTSVFPEYGLPLLLTADFGNHFVSEMFKRKCEESGVGLTLSSPYKHQANFAAEQSVGTTKSLWKKAVANDQCPETALWMYRITPLDDHHMNSCTGENLDHHYRLVILLSCQTTLAILLGRKPISRNKSRRPNSTIGRPAATSVSLTRPNQCTYGTQESMFGNRARFSTAKTLIENQEHMLLR